MSDPDSPSSIEPVRSGIPFTAAGFLAFAAPTAWLVAYFYRLGFAAHYGIPREILTVDVGDVLVAGVIVTLVGVVVLIILDTLFGVLWRRIPAVVRNHLVAPSLLLACLLCVEFAFDERYVPWLPAVATMVFVAVMFGLPLLWEPKARGYKMKLIAFHESLDQLMPTVESSVLNHYRLRYRQAYLLALVAALVVLFALLVGGRSAALTNRYTLLGQPPARVVLLVTGRAAITAPLDLKNGTYKRVFTLEPLDSLESVLPRRNLSLEGAE